MCLEGKKGKLVIVVCQEGTLFIPQRLNPNHSPQLLKLVLLASILPFEIFIFFVKVLKLGKTLSLNTGRLDDEKRNFIGKISLISKIAKPLQWCFFYDTK